MTTKLTKLIKNRRNEIELSQCKLAKALGFINGQFISNIERGGAEYPPVYFKALSRALKIPLKNILDAAIDDYKVWLHKNIRGA